MAQKTTEKRGLLAASIIVAIVIWFIVGTVVNPTGSRYIYDIPIIKESAALDALGLDIMSGLDKTVNVQISGPKLEISSLTASDFFITPRISGISSPGVYTLDLDITVNSPSSVTVESISPKSVSVRLARLETREFEIGWIVDSSTEVPEGFRLDSVALSSQTVTIEGESDVLQKISTADVVIKDFSNTTQTLPIGLFDSEGNELDSANYSLGIADVEATLSLLKTKDITLIADIANISQYHIADLITRTVLPTRVTIAGPADAIDLIGDEYVVDTTDISKISGSTNSVITPKFPAGIKIISGIETVEVKTEVSGVSTGSFTVSNIVLDPSLAGSGITVDTQQIRNVTIAGRSNEIPELDPSSLFAVVVCDKSQLPPKGQSTMTVRISTQSGTVWAVGSYTVNVTVT